MMDDSGLTNQELFDSQACWTPTQIQMLMDFHNLWSKYYDEAKAGRMSASYYKEIKELSDEYMVAYTEPKYRAGLQGVGTPATLH